MKSSLLKILIGVVSIGCVLTSCQTTSSSVAPTDQTSVTTATSSTTGAKPTSGTKPTTGTSTTTGPSENVVEKRIRIKSQPTKKSFVVGDLFTVAGLAIEKYQVVNGKESSPVDVSSSEFTLSLQEGTKLTEANPKLEVIVSMLEEGYNSLTLTFVVTAPNEYAVTFENYDGTTLQTTSVIEGKTAVYSGATPTREADKELYYSFQGWYVKGDEKQTLVDITSYKITKAVTFVASYKASQNAQEDAIFAYSLDGTKAIVTGFSSQIKDGDKVNVVIPDTFSGLPVTEVGESAFYSESTIQTLTIGKNVKILNKSAFEGCTALTKVTFATGSVLETIGDNAFYGCEALAEIVTPSTLKSIGKNAFYKALLSTFTLNEGLETIGESAFSYSSLQVFTLPDSVTNIGEELFANCKMLTTIKIGKTRKSLLPTEIFGTTEPSSFSKFEVDPANTSLVSDNGVLYSYDKTILYCVPANNYSLIEDQEAAKIFTIPDSVITIEPYALNYCQTYTKIIFGKALQTIGEYAFNYDNRISELDFTKSTQLTTIGAYAFKGAAGGYYAKNVNVVLPDSVTTIGDYAFSENPNLVAFKIGAGVANVGMNFFDRDSNLKADKITFAAGSKLVQDNGLVYSEGKTKLLFNLSFSGDTFTAPEALEEINGGVFANSSTLTSVVFPANSKLKIIGPSAFESCDKLTGAIALPSTLQTIGDSAFARDSSVTSFTIPETLKSIGDQAFGYTDATIEKVVFASDATVNNQAFYNASGLKEVEIHTNRLGTGIFDSATGLTKATLGEEVTALPENTFVDASSLATLVFSTNLTELGPSSLSGTTALKSFDFSHITKIGEAAFRESGLTSAVIPSTVTDFGESVFEDASELTEVTLNNTFDVLPSSTFQGTSKLSKVTITTPYKEIGGNAFYQASSLKGITLPESLTTIEDSAFKDSGLTSIVIPDAVTSIGSSVFQDCTSLTSVKLPSTLTTLPSSLFFGCTSLTTIEIPASVTVILGSFYKSGVKSLTIPGTLDVENSVNIFNGMSSLETLNLAGGLSAPTIPGNMFQNDSSLKTITGLGNITKVEYNAFDGTASLTALPFDTSKLEEIGSSAFANMTSLTSFTLPTTAAYTKIEDNTFDGDTALTEIHIPANITTLGDDVFANCSKLTTIYVENPTLNFADADTYSPAFEESGLTTVHFKGTMAQAKATNWLNGETSENLFGWGTPNDVTVYCSDGTYTIPKSKA